MKSTAETLRALAAQFEAEGLAALEQLDEEASRRAYRRAHFCRQIADEVEAETFDVPRLPEAPNLGTLGTMQPTPSRAASVSAAMMDPTRHVLLWEVLKRLKLSLPQMVAKFYEGELEQGTARSWTKRPGKGGRATPRAWADRLAKDLGEPRLRLAKNWPNGIREESTDAK